MGYQEKGLIALTKFFAVLMGAVTLITSAFFGSEKSVFVTSKGVLMPASHKAVPVARIGAIPALTPTIVDLVTALVILPEAKSFTLDTS